MAEASLKIAVNTQELEKSLGAFDKLDKKTKSAVAEMRKMEYAYLDAGKTISNVEKVTRQLNDTNGKFVGVSQTVKDGLLAQAAALDSVAKRSSAANDSYKGTGGAIRNVSYQMQDFATQVGAGTSASTALGQQLPQLLSGFGLMGVVLGTVTAVIIPLVNSLGLFDTKAEKASKALEKFGKELSATAELGGEVSKFVKDFTQTSADGFVDYVKAYNKASESQRKEMDLWLQKKLLVEQAKLADIASEAQGRQIDFGAGQAGGAGAGSMQFDPNLERQVELAQLYRVQADNVKRLTAAVQGDFGAATAGAKATSEQKSQESLIQSYDRKIAAINAEASALQTSNVERKLAVELANLEIDREKLGTKAYLEKKDALTKAVYARNTEEEDKKLKAYTKTQEEYNLILELEGQRATMTTREYERMVEEKRLNIQLDKEVIGMLPAHEEAYRKNAKALFEVGQGIKDTNDAQKRTFGGGATEALNKYAQDASNAGAQVGATFTNAFKGMEDAMVQFVTSGKLNFTNFANSVIADIARILVRQALIAPIAGGVGSLLGLGSATKVAAVPLATGTNYVPYDGMPATLHKGEAVIPAKYNPAAGGSGLGSVNNVVTVNVSMNNTGGTETQTANGQDATKFGVMISNAVKSAIIKEQRNGGLLSGA